MKIKTIKIFKNNSWEDHGFFVNFKNGAGRGSIISSNTKDEDTDKDYSSLRFQDPEAENILTGWYNYLPEATEQESFAFGKGAKAFGLRSLAIGTAAFAMNPGSVAIGQAVKSRGDGAAAFGNSTIAGGTYAMATGHLNGSLGDMSFTSGRENEAKENWSAVFGVRNKGYAQATFVTGIDNESTSYAGLTSGTNNTNAAEKSFVVGVFNINTGKHSITCGKNNNADSFSGLTSGEYNINKGLRSFVSGGSDVEANGNHIYGNNSAIIGGYGNKIGDEGSTGVNYNIILGGNANKIINGTHNLVGGAGHNIYGSYKTVFGYQNITSTNSSSQFICGKLSKASDNAILIVGNGNTERANAFEILNTNSLVLGKQKAFYGNSSAIVGGYDNTIGSADKQGTHYNFIAAGNGNTIYNGTRNVVGGAGNYVYGSYKTVFGYANLTPDNSNTQFICGKLSNAVENALFIVGNGGDKRLNAFEVLNDNRAKVYGKPLEAEDVIRKQDIDEVYVGLNMDFFKSIY